MKLLILMIVMATGLFSCTSDTGKKEGGNMAIAKRYMEAVETGNVKVMDSLLSDNYMGYGPSVGDSTNKADALKSYKYTVDNLYESVKYTRHKELEVTVKEGEAAGDWILNWALLTIKYKDGRGPVNIWVNSIYKTDSGKIVYSRTFYNEADVLRQLGYSIAPPKE